MLNADLRWDANCFGFWLRDAWNSFKITVTTTTASTVSIGKTTQNCVEGDVGEP